MIFVPLHALPGIFHKTALCPCLGQRACALEGLLYASASLAKPISVVAGKNTESGGAFVCRPKHFWLSVLPHFKGLLTVAGIPSAVYDNFSLYA